VDKSILVLDIDQAGKVRESGKPLTPEALQKLLAQKAKGAGGVDKLTGVVRAHRDTEYAKVYEVLNQLRNAGMRRIQLRAAPADKK
jgi:biopolymer transport protein ExbD